VAEQSIEELIKSWDGEAVAMHRDRETGTLMFVCSHSSRLGPSAGGTRMKHYARAVDALEDCMRLSEAMTLKLASVSFPHGGGKAVIDLPSPDLPQGEARRRLMHEFGRFVKSLGGLFSCAPDMNTSSADMDVIAEVCPYVFGRTESAGGAGDTAPDTAVGVFHGIRASCRFVFGSDDLHGRSVLVQGAGGVGGRLIELLLEAGAEVIASDIDPMRAARLESMGVRMVTSKAVIATQCDVFAPCATGGVLNAQTIPELRCRIVAGAANNQLEKESDADLLRDRGIAYAPDFVINAGGVLHGGGLEEQGWTREVLNTHLEGIGDVVYEILERAEREGINTDSAARQIAQSRIDAAPA
jgi:leucine dehydrogenase